MQIDLFKKSPIFLDLIYLIFVFFVFTTSTFDVSPLISLGALVIFSLFILITKIPQKLILKKSREVNIFSFIFAVFAALHFSKVVIAANIILFITNSIFVFFLSFWFYRCCLNDVSVKYKKKLIYSLFSVIPFFFLLILYLPFESYISNISDFEFDCTNFFPFLIFKFLTITGCSVLLLNLLKAKIYWVIYKIIISFNICTFIQYMFLNKHLELLGVANEVSFPVDVIVINLLIWILVFVAVFVFSHFAKNLWMKSYNVISIAILSYHVVAFVIILVLAPSQAFRIQKDFYFDTSEQYTLSNNSNVVFIIFDAFDNKLFLDSIKENPTLMEGLEDFTVYTNTSSVYDSTGTSLSQIYGNCQFNNTLTSEEWLDSGWNSEETIEFYNQLHDKNYVCNAYNFDISNTEYIDGKFDNIKKYENPEVIKPVDFYIEKFYSDFERLSLYRISPYFIKNFIKFDSMCFKYYCFYPESNDAMYDNEDYLSNMNYDYIDDNVFMVNHLRGIHSPCIIDDEIVNCFSIMKSVVKQLKENGSYNDSTIVFMADHGIHNEDAEWSWGATPLFLIKAPDSQSNEVTFSKAPISTTDVLGTIVDIVDIPSLDNLSSIYDFDENSIRVRCFYDRVYSKDYPDVFSKGKLSYVMLTNAYAKFEFEGDSSQLYGWNPFEENNEILPMKEYFG